MKTHYQNPFLIDLGENYISEQEKLLLTKDNHRIHLTRSEIFLLQLFLQKNDQLSNNEHIINTLFDNGIEINEKGIRNLISMLRKKLPDNFIKSVYGMGYKVILST